MEYLQLVGVAITFGSVLGGITAGFFAARQKSRTLLLEAMNGDYEKRVKQLEDDGDAKDTRIVQLEKTVTRLEHEKALPLDKLIRLVTSQHDATQESIMTLAKAIEKIATNNQKGKKK